MKKILAAVLLALVLVIAAAGTAEAAPAPAAAPRYVTGLVMLKMHTWSGCNMLELATSRSGARANVCVSDADYARARWLSWWSGYAL